MYIPKKLSKLKLKSIIRSLASPASAGSVTPLSYVSAPYREVTVSDITEGLESSPTTSVANDHNPQEWPYLGLLHKALVSYTGLQFHQIKALRSATSKLLKCTNYFDGHLKESSEYKVLRGELEVLFKELRQCYDRDVPIEMAEMINGVCLSVGLELLNVQGIHYRSRVEPEAEGANNHVMSDMLECFRRIRGHFQCLIANIGTLVAKQITDVSLMDLLLEYSLPVSYARYISGSPLIERGECSRGTRVGVLNQMHTWIYDPNSSSVYWINGMAGTGKTTIGFSLCDSLYADGRLAASFFCSRQLPQCSDSSVIIPSIAYQLAEFSYSFYNALSSSLRNLDWKPNTWSRDLQFTTLIYQPLLEVRHTLPGPIVIVIDALDECEDKEGVSRLVEVLLTKAPDLPVKFVMCSRPEPEMRGPIKRQKNPATLQLILHELDKNTVREDIKLYLRSKAYVWPMGFMHRQLTNDDVITLAERADVFFMFSAAVLRYISEKGGDEECYTRRLTQVLTSPEISGEGYENHIHTMYNLILKVALEDQTLKRETVYDMKRVLYIVARAPAEEPTTVGAISRLLGMDNTDRIWAALQPLWSVLHVSENNGTVTTLHPSFPEYILNPFHSRRYCCDPNAYASIFRLFHKPQSQFNIGGLNTSYVPDNKIAGMKEKVRRAVSADLFYAARDWIEHLRATPVDILPALLQDLEEFLSARLLLWMEIMNLQGCGPQMPGVFQQLREWALYNAECPAALREFTQDALHFIATFSFGTVSKSTPHIYTSMLHFWPESSPITRCYSKHLKRAIGIEGMGVGQQHSTLLTTWRFDDTTKSPVFSPDGSGIAVGVGHDVLLLSASTGQNVLPPFKGHSSTVLTVQFSPDGERIVSISLDNSIRVWSTKLGVTITGPLKEHTSLVDSITFSPDGALIVSGSVDDTISIWNAHNGQRLFGPLTGHNSNIISIKYSAKGKCMVFGGCNRGVVERDGRNGRALTTHFPLIDDLAFHATDISPDGGFVASGSNCNAIYVWNLKTGQVVLGPLKAADKRIDEHAHLRTTSISFSRDGSHLASSFSDQNIYLWDTQTGNLALGPLEGHTGGITSVSFSPDGAYIVSGSYDKTLRLWSVKNLGTKGNVLHGHASSVTSVGFSPDGARIVSGSTDRTVCVWDIQNGRMLLGPIQKGQCDKLLVTYLPSGSQILSNSVDGLLLLDAKTGHPSLDSIRFSKSAQIATFSSSARGTPVIVGSIKSSVRVWSASTGRSLVEIPPPINNLSDWVTSIACSPCGTRIAIGWVRSRLNLYETQSGRLLCGPLDDFNNGCRSLSFSPDSTRIVLGLFSAVLVRDAQNGAIVLGPLKGQVGWIDSVEFSPDGSYIVSGARDGSICVWDARVGRPVLGPAKWHTGPVRSVKFSPDGTQIVSGSDDKTIRVTNIRKDLRFVSNSLTPTGCDWDLKEDGWIVDTEGRLLVWIPSELRTSLMWPRTQLLISRNGWLRLKFNKARLGEAWAECYKPEY